jgi:hypothetical protein
MEGGLGEVEVDGRTAMGAPVSANLVRVNGGRNVEASI